MRHRKKDDRPRWGLMFWLGLAMSTAGVVVLGSIPYFYLRSAYVGNQLLKQAGNLVSNSTAMANASGNVTDPVDAANGVANGSANHVDGLQLTSEALQTPGFNTGQLIGDVVIPALNLKAPLIQGTNAPQLEVAVGHLTTSVMPGKPGTTVIAAHNATWFRHVDRLKPGDTIEVQTTYGVFAFDVTHAKVVKVGDPVPNTPEGSVVLESCYPLNALYLTPYRYLVFGTLRKISDVHVQPSAAQTQGAYYDVVPNRIAREGLTLSSNTLPMGTLTYTGHPADAFTQSNDAWSSAHTMVELYLAWLHASADKDLAAIATLVPTGSPDPFYGVNRQTITYLSSYDISLDVEGDKLVSTTGTVRVRVSGKVYTIVLHGTAYGKQVKLTRIQVSPI